VLVRLQVEHIVSEKRVMQIMNHQFLLDLKATYQVKIVVFR
jgi:hypothetical protein